MDKITYKSICILTTLAFLLVANQVTFGNGNISKNAFILMLDGTAIEAENLAKVGDSYHYDVNGLPGFVKSSLVSKILTKEQYRKLQSKNKVTGKAQENIDLIKDSRSIKQTLTNQSFSGSSNQSTILLELIEKNPGLDDYQVSKEQNGEVTIFGCNLRKDILIRIHQRSNGQGTQETWRSHVLFRLKKSRSGGSLNETPIGKKQGIFQTF